MFGGKSSVQEFHLPLPATGPKNMEKSSIKSWWKYIKFHQLFSSHIDTSHHVTSHQIQCHSIIFPFLHFPLSSLFVVSSFPNKIPILPLLPNRPILSFQTNSFNFTPLHYYLPINKNNSKSNKPGSRIGQSITLQVWFLAERTVAWPFLFVAARVENTCRHFVL